MRFICFLIFVLSLCPATGSAADNWESEKCVEYTIVDGVRTVVKDPDIALGTGFSRDLCFQALGFSVMVRHLVTEGALINEDHGIFRYKPHPGHVETCNWDIAPDLEAIPIFVLQAILKNTSDLLPPAVKSDEFKKEIEKAILMNCVVHSS